MPQPVGGTAGIDHLSRARELAVAWRLTLGEPFAAGAGGLALPARSADGDELVLKLVTPHREARYEGRALQLLDGRGAVRLLRTTADGLGLLLERCRPGTPLSTAGARQALDVLVGLLPRQWVPADPVIATARDEAAGWLANLRSWTAPAPRVRRLVDAAVERLEWLADTQGEQVLVNQDLHGDNVLAAEREPWLLIDPKPLVGERELGAAPVVRSPELGHSARDVRYRVDRLVGELGLDRERVLGWAVGQTVAWCREGDRVFGTHLDVASWLLDG